MKTLFHTGWARTLHIHPDSSADLLRHRPAQLNRGVRWICHTANQDALGMEPCTAEVEGFNAEKAKGNLRMLAGGNSFTSELQVGVLTAEEARAEERLVQQALAGAAP